MLTAWQKMDANGYSAHQGQQPPTTDNTPPFDFHIEPSMWQGFQDVLALNGSTRTQIF